MRTLKRDPRVVGLALFGSLLLGWSGLTSCGGGTIPNTSGRNNGSGGSGGGNPPAAVNISGKWEFTNGMNVNLSQSNSSLSGTGVGVVKANSPNPPNTLVLNPCIPNSGSGQVRDLTVTLSIGTCDIPPPGGYQTQTTANASATLMTGGAWGDSFLVPSLSGTYSGTLDLYGAVGYLGSSGASLELTEDQDHNLVGTLTIVNGNSPPQMTGATVGGAINLGNQEIVGLVSQTGGIEITVITGSALFCTYSACADVGNGLLK